MSLKLVVLALLATQGWGASFNSKHEGLQQYHEGMKTMWMADETGKLVEVHLTKEGEKTTLTGVNVGANVFFYLYTPESNSAYQIYRNDLATLQSSTFDASRPTKVLIHGFANSYTSDAEQTIKEAFIGAQDVNVIAVDWRALAKSPLYFSAVAHVKPVGQQIALLIDFLVSAGADVTSFHLIGHSLGAHVASFAANYVTSGRISRITGLDPALPLYAGRDPSKRLDPMDAEVVDCIHSCGGVLGFYTPLCTHDFYPNGGTPAQPGCSNDLVGACSHGRSHSFFTATITNPDSFVATSCTSTDEVKDENCSGGDTAFMGINALNAPEGIYYLRTTSDYPYFES